MFISYFIGLLFFIPSYGSNTGLVIDQLKCTESIPNIFQTKLWVTPRTVCSAKIKNLTPDTLTIYVNRRENGQYRPFGGEHEVQWSLNTLKQNRNSSGVEILFVQKGQAPLRLKTLELLPLPNTEMIETCERRFDSEKVQHFFFCSSEDQNAPGLEFSSKKNVLTVYSLKDEKKKFINIAPSSNTVLYEVYRLGSQFLIKIENYTLKLSQFMSIDHELKAHPVRFNRSFSRSRLGLFSKAAPQQNRLYFYEFSSTLLDRSTETLAPLVVEFLINEKTQSLSHQVRYDQSIFCKRHPQQCGKVIQFHYLDAENSCLRMDVNSEESVQELRECF